MDADADRQYNKVCKCNYALSEPIPNSIYLGTARAAWRAYVIEFSCNWIGQWSWL